MEREDDLYITHGVLFRSLVAVPVRPDAAGRGGVRTAGAGLRAGHRDPEDGQRRDQRSHPRLAPDEATRLRDRLTELGEAHASGL